MIQIQNPTIWLLDDGRRGHLKQSQALLNAMLRQSDGQSKTLQAMPVETISIQLTRWQRWLAPRILPGADRQLNSMPESEPAIVIGAGSHCALYSRLIKRRYPNTFNIQILDPRFARQDFSVLVIPEHDQVELDNVITMRGSLVEIPEMANGHEDIWPGGDATKLAVLLAGNKHENQRLLQLAKQQTQVGKIQCVISLAPRTDSTLQEIIHREWQGLAYRIITPDEGSKNYHCLLNTAMQFWVAADSINQLSEVLTARGTRSIWIEPMLTIRNHRKKHWIDSLLSMDEVRLLKDYPQQSASTAVAISCEFWKQQLNKVAKRVINQLCAQGKNFPEK